MELKRTMLALLALGTTPVYADYYADVSLSQSWDKNSDGSSDHSKKSADASATIYLKPVSQAQGPYAEAPFLSKSSSVELGTWHDGHTRDRDGHDDFSIDELDVTYLGGKYIVPDINMIVQALFGRAQDSIDANIAQLGLGAYVTDRASVVLDYSRLKNEELPYDEYTDDAWTLTYHQQIDIGGGQYIVVEPHIRSGKYHDDLDTSEAGVETAWYFTPALGVRAGYDQYSQERIGENDARTKEYFVGVDYFVMDDIRVGTVVKKLQRNKDVYESDSDREGAELYVSLLVK
jgi:hypothetical protein